MFELPRMLLISGTGRNSGKTSLACHLLDWWKDQYPLYALKITPHIHDIDKGGEILEENNRFLLMEEKTMDGSKDTMRYLRAGATRSFLIMAKDDQLGEALGSLFGLTGDQIWICESGGARRWIKPGVYLVVSTDWESIHSKEVNERLKFADQKILMRDQVFDPDPGFLKLNEKEWRLAGKY